MTIEDVKAIPSARFAAPDSLYALDCTSSSERFWQMMGERKYS